MNRLPKRNINPNTGKRHGTTPIGKPKHPRASRVTVTQVSPQTLKRRFRATGKYGR